MGGRWGIRSILYYCMYCRDYHIEFCSLCNRIRFPFITVEEEEPRLFTGEIFKAILDNDQATLEILIADGFPVNQRDLHRMTPLQR